MINKRGNGLTVSALILSVLQGGKPIDRLKFLSEKAFVGVADPIDDLGDRKWSGCQQLGGNFAPSFLQISREGKTGLFLQ